MLTHKHVPKDVGLCNIVVTEEGDMGRCTRGKQKQHKLVLKKVKEKIKNTIAGNGHGGNNGGGSGEKGGDRADGSSNSKEDERDVAAQSMGDVDERGYSTMHVLREGEDISAIPIIRTFELMSASNDPKHVGVGKLDVDVLNDPMLGTTQDMDTTATHASGEPATRQQQDKGVMVTGYITNKLHPSDEDRVPSEAISGPVKRRKEDVAQRVLARDDTLVKVREAPTQVLTKAREANTSLTDRNRVSDTVQPQS
uniref:LTI65/LTI78 PGEED repeat domain-containing protein n=1 Tax=Oryza punctata TaxID=4537 RepID=A0A0E0JNA2_ORYPU